MKQRETNPQTSFRESDALFCATGGSGSGSTLSVRRFGSLTRARIRSMSSSSFTGRSYQIVLLAKRENRDGHRLWVVFVHQVRSVGDPNVHRVRDRLRETLIDPLLEHGRFLERECSYEIGALLRDEQAHKSSPSRRML